MVCEGSKGATNLGQSMVKLIEAPFSEVGGSSNQFVSAGGRANTNTLEPPVGELKPCGRRSM